MPAVARPSPSNLPLEFLIAFFAEWPSMIAGIPVKQARPTKASMPQMSDAIAAPEVSLLLWFWLDIF